MQRQSIKTKQFNSKIKLLISNLKNVCKDKSIKTKQFNSKIKLLISNLKVVKLKNLLFKLWLSMETVQLFIYLFGVLRRFQHCTGHITTGSWEGRGNQYIEFARVLYCKLPTNGKQLPAFPHKALTGIKPRPQRWEARVLPLCHRGPCTIKKKNT